LIVDSSIVIDHLRGRAAAADFLQARLISEGLMSHAVVVAEVLTGARDAREQAEIERVFEQFSIVNVDEETSRQSLELLRQFWLSHAIGWHDCLIAATCLRRGLPVATLNDRHFRPIAGLEVVRPY
jgi:predicted nucleic acid-binding protein